MQYSSRLTIATHILLAIRNFEGPYKVTSEFLANSIQVNPVIIRRILGQLKKAGWIQVESGVGGTILTKDLKELSLWDVFCVVEDEQESLFHFHENPNMECPVGKNMHLILDDKLEDAQKAMRKKLMQVNLNDLYRELKANNKKDRHG